MNYQKNRIKNYVFFKLICRKKERRTIKFIKDKRHVLINVMLVKDRIELEKEEMNKMEEIEN